MRRLLGVAAIISAFVVACASLSGADDLYVGAPDGGTASSSGEPADNEGGSVVGEGGSERDADVDPPLAECTGGVCVLSSDGWSPATTPPGSGGCPPGWPMRTGYTAAQPLSCACTCTPNGGSCEGPLSAYNEGFNCGGSAKPLPDFPGDGSCVAKQLTGLTITSPTKLVASPTNPPTSCTGASSPTGGGTTDVAVCTGSTPIADAQCKPTETCLARPGAGSVLCIVHEGLVSCPPGFGRRTEISTGIVSDNRTCSSCACGVDCNGGKLDAFFSTSCSTPYGSATVGACQPAPIANGASFRYTASKGCAVSQPSQVEGTVEMPAPMTLCCTRQGGG